MATTCEELKNGAKVLERKGDVVLASWGKEYVTWRVDAELNAYWGHYFREYKDALADFRKRTD